MPTQRVDIAFDGIGGKGIGTLKCDGKEFQCLGKYGFKYPHDSTINTGDKDHNHYSKEFRVPLPWAVLLDGNRGVYIHQDVSSSQSNLAFDNTHGCINLMPEEAQWFYNWIQGRTRIVITYPW